MAMTFFEWVARDGQAAVGVALGAGFHAVRIHRATYAKHGVDEGLIARCEAVLGAEFDRAGTLDRWYQLRRLRLAEPEPTPADDEPALAEPTSPATDQTAAA